MYESYARRSLRAIEGFAQNTVKLTLDRPAPNACARSSLTARMAWHAGARRNPVLFTPSLDRKAADNGKGRAQNRNCKLAPLRDYYRIGSSSLIDRAQRAS